MDENPRRRWFRFSLRTLFVLMTLCGCWLGWQAHLIRQRRELWAQWEGAHNRPTMFAKLLGVRTITPTRVELPWWREALGDKLFSGPLTVLDTTPTYEIQRLVDTFPETTLDIVSPIPTPGKDMVNR